MRIWNLRALASRIVVLKLNKQVCNMSIIANQVVITTDDQKITIHDLRNLSQLGDIHKSPLKFKTCCVSCCLDGTNIFYYL